MPAVWNRLTTQISGPKLFSFWFSSFNNYKSDIASWFGDDSKRNCSGNSRKEGKLRPSCSLSALNQKNLRIIQSCTSTENLNRVHQLICQQQQQQQGQQQQQQYCPLLLSNGGGGGANSSAAVFHPTGQQSSSTKRGKFFQQKQVPPTTLRIILEYIVI